MADVADFNRKQMQKSYDEGHDFGYNEGRVDGFQVGYRAAIEAAVGILGRFAQQFGEGTNPRIALTVAAEGVRDLEVGR